jgi:hypothetical protein
MAGVVGVIWVCGEEVYFCEQDWTGQIMLKSLWKIDFSRRPAIWPTGTTKGLCGWSSNTPSPIAMIDDQLMH